MYFGGKIISLYIHFEFDGAIASNSRFYKSGNLDLNMQQVTLQNLQYLFEFVSVNVDYTTG